MFLHPEPYARPTQNISIPRGEALSLSQCCLTELFRYSKTVNTLDNMSTCTWFVSKVRLLWQCVNIASMFLNDSSALLIIIAVPTNKDYTLAEVCFAADREMRLHLHLLKASINETRCKNNSLAWLTASYFMQNYDSKDNFRNETRVIYLQTYSSFNLNHIHFLSKIWITK